MNLSIIPNILTCSRIAMTPIIAYLLSLGGEGLLLALFFFSCAALTDFYDGYLARRHNWPSAFGRFLDPLADKILVLTVFAMFAVHNLCPFWTVWLLAGRDVVMTVLRIALAQIGKPLVTSRLGKAKTAFQFATIYAFFAVMIVRNYRCAMTMPYHYLTKSLEVLADACLWSMIGLTLISGGVYCYGAAKVFCRYWLRDRHNRVV